MSAHRVGTSAIALSGDTAAAVAPRAAATTLIVRDGVPGLEVLMVRRSLQASFMPGAYVFPGGAVDAADGAAESLAAGDEPTEVLARRIGAVTEVGDRAPAYAVAAVRECFEECGLWLGAADGHEPANGGWAALRARLHAGESLAALASAAGTPLGTSVLRAWGHWVTPLGLPKRVDTLFFVAPAPPGQWPTVDAGETTTLAWVRPATALAGAELPMEFVTVRMLESLRPFADSAALLAHATARGRLPVVHPRLQLDTEGRIRGVLLPGHAGYDEAQGGR